MRLIKEIKQDYRFTPEDERRLARLKPLMEEHTEEIMSTVSLWFKGTKGAAKFFTEETLQQHVFASQEGLVRCCSFPANTTTPTTTN